MSSVSWAMRVRPSAGMCSSVRMLCSRSASLTSSTRTSSAMASRSLRRFSACLASRETRSSFFSLVRPSTRWPMSGPKIWSISARVVGRVLDRVVQQRRRDRGVVELEVGQDGGDLERMGEVRVAGGALLLAVRLHGVDIGAVEQRLVGVRVVAADPLDQIVLPHHRGRLLRFSQFGQRLAEATFKPSASGARPLAGFCIRGRSVFERAMTRPRPPAAGTSGFAGAPAAFPPAGYHGDSTTPQGRSRKAVHEMRNTEERLQSYQRPGRRAEQRRFGRLSPGRWQLCCNLIRRRRARAAPRAEPGPRGP